MEVVCNVFFVRLVRNVQISSWGACLWSVLMVKMDEETLVSSPAEPSELEVGLGSAVVRVQGSLLLPFSPCALNFPPPMMFPRHALIFCLSPWSAPWKRWLSRAYSSGLMSEFSNTSQCEAVTTEDGTRLEWPRIAVSAAWIRATIM